MLPHPLVPVVAAILTISLALRVPGQPVLLGGCGWSLSAADTISVSHWTLANCAAIPLPAYAVNGSEGNGWVPLGREPALWLPAEMRPSPQATSLLLADLTLQLPDCISLWDLAKQECTFSPSAHWPSSGVQAGPGFLFYRRQTGLFSTAERVNLTCPLADWESLLAAASPPLAPCGTAIVTTGEQLLQALKQLQPAHARVLVTLDANITLPTEPTPQRGIATNHDVTPLANIYRNVTLAGGGRRLANGGGTELDVRLRRNAFDISTDPMAPLITSLDSPVSRQEFPVVLSLADLHVVNMPQGSPDAWPLGLMSHWYYYVRLARSNMQVMTLRLVSVHTLTEMGYAAFWFNRMNASTEQASWLQRITGLDTQVLDDEDRLIRYRAQHNPSSTDNQDSVIGYNSTSSPLPLLTAPSALEVDMFSLPQNRMLPATSVAWAFNATQLLGLLQESWTGGWRAILVMRNMTLTPELWPRDGASLSYNVTLVGPAAGEPVQLDLGGLQLARSRITDGGSATCQFMRLRLVSVSPLVFVSRQAIESASVLNGMANGTALRMWSDRCLQPTAVGAATSYNASGAATLSVKHELHSCTLEIPQDMVDLIGALNVPGAACNGSAGPSLVVAAMCGLFGESRPLTGTAPPARSNATTRFLKVMRTVLVVNGGQAVYTSRADAIGSISSIRFLDTATPAMLGGMPMSNTFVYTSVPPPATPPALPEVTVTGSTSSAQVVDVGQCSASTLLSAALLMTVELPPSTLPPATPPPLPLRLPPSSPPVGPPPPSPPLRPPQQPVSTTAAALFTAIDGGDDGGDDAGPPVAGIIGGAVGGAVALLACGGLLLAWLGARRRLIADGINADKAGLADVPEQSLAAPAVVAIIACSRSSSSSSAGGAADTAAAVMPDPASRQASVTKMASGEATDVNIEESGVGCGPSDSFAQEPASWTMANMIGLQCGAAAATVPAIQTLEPAETAAVQCPAVHPVSGATTRSASTPRFALHSVMAEEIGAMISMCAKATHSTGSSESVPGRSRTRKRLLGRGAYGAVYLGEWRALPVAIKVMIFQAGDSAGRRERIAREVALTTTLENPFVVPTYRFFLDTIRAGGGTSGHIPNTLLETLEEKSSEEGEEDDDVAALRLRLVMQYCEGGTLSSALQRGVFGGCSVAPPRPPSSTAVLPPPPLPPLAQHPQHQAPAAPQLAPIRATPPQEIAPASSEGTEVAACSSRSPCTGSNDPPLNPNGHVLLPVEPEAVTPRSQAQLLSGGSVGGSGPHQHQYQGNAVAAVATAMLAATVATAGTSAAACTKLCAWSDIAPATNLPLALLAALDVARGLAYLHDRSVIHGDLNDNNILLKAVQPQIAAQRVKRPVSEAAARWNGADSLKMTAGSSSVDTSGGGGSGCAAPATASAPLTALLVEGGGSGGGSDGGSVPSAPAVWPSRQLPPQLLLPPQQAGGHNSADDSGSNTATNHSRFAARPLHRHYPMWRSGESATSGSAAGSGRLLGGRDSTTGGSMASNSGPEVAAELLMYTFKIADFGLSVQLHDPSQTHVSNLAQGTPFFAAPEVMEAGRMSPAADIYSFGVVLWLLCHGVSLGQVRHLLPRMHHIPIASLLLSHASSSLPHTAHHLLQRCLDLQPSRRPQAAELQRRLEELLKETAGPEMARLLLSIERKEHLEHVQ